MKLSKVKLVEIPRYIICRLGNVGNAFGGIQEDKFCKTEKCLDEQLNLRTLTKQNGMQFSTPDIDNDYYCR